MDEKTLQLLDFPKMVALCASLAETARGKAAAESLRPQTDRLTVESLLEETQEGIEFLQQVSCPLSGVKTIDEAVVKSRISGAVLQPGSLLDVSSTLDACARLRHRFSKLELRLDRLKRRIALLSPLPEITQAIESAIAANGEIKDNASPELRRIRIKAAAARKKAKETLDAILRSRTGAIAAQEHYVTVRDGRYVLPVRSEMRSSVPGVVHDQSSSGATVFVEPNETVELNNAIRQLAIEEEREIERILRALTSLVGSHADDIARNVELLAELDCILARSRFSNLLDSTKPRVSDDDRLVLNGARHPLLVLAQKGYRAELTPKRQDEPLPMAEELTSTQLSQRLLFEKPERPGLQEDAGPTVVPIDVAVGGEYQTLVITGPNTGGKTVALKTTGLLALLAQTGFHIPAREGSHVPIYQNVFADIGDEQGIEQSLSTFSSHMGQIVKIVRGLSPKSLVLLDEMGAGTDPSEGSALAIAILKHMTRAKVHTIATTHHNSLKVFAHTAPGVRNASVQFDPLSLQPTFRLEIGLPGSSNAFEIAKRLGLPEELVSQARSSLSVESRRVSELLAFLDQEKSAVRAKSEELVRKTEETSAIRNELERSLRFAKARSQQVLESARTEADELIKKTKSEIRSIMTSLRKKKSSETLTPQDVDRARTRIEALKKEAPRDTEEGPRAAEGPQASPLTIQSVRKDMRVRILGLDVDGVVTKVLDSKQEVEVSLGGIKVRAKVDTLAPVSGSSEAPAEVALPPSVKDLKRPPPELLLIGMTREEALDALERYLDQVVVWGLKEVRIVHGVGKGVLKAAVAESLKTHPGVESFAVAPPHQGGPGATVVLLKE